MMLNYEQLTKAILIQTHANSNYNVYIGPDVNI